MYDKASIVKAALAARKSKKQKPSAGMSKGAKSAAVKDAKEGKDMGDKGKNFEKIEAGAAKKYGSEAAGKKVAGAVFWQKIKARG